MIESGQVTGTLNSINPRPCAEIDPLWRTVAATPVARPCGFRGIRVRFPAGSPRSVRLAAWDLGSLSRLGDRLCGNRVCGIRNESSAPCLFLPPV